MREYELNEYLRPCYSILVNAVSWMEAEGFDNPDSRDLVSYRGGYISKTRVAYTDQEPELSEAEEIIKDLTVTSHRAEFVKIIQYVSDKLTDAYNYTMPEIAAPLLSNGGPVSAPSAKSCIFHPNSGIDIPLTDVTLDQSGWDMSGVTVNVSRMGDAKYTCDELDIVDNIAVKSSRYPIPIQYDTDAGVTLPDTANIKSINSDFVKAMSFFIFTQRYEYETSSIHSRVYEPVFNGIYVTPLIMLYYNMVEYRDKSLTLQ